MGRDHRLRWLYFLILCTVVLTDDYSVHVDNSTCRPYRLCPTPRQNVIYHYPPNAAGLQDRLSVISTMASIASLFCASLDFSKPHSTLTSFHLGKDLPVSKALTWDHFMKFTFHDNTTIWNGQVMSCAV